LIIVEFSYTSTNFDEIMLIRRVLAWNERKKSGKKVLLCLAKRDIDRWNWPLFKLGNLWYWRNAKM